MNPLNADIETPGCVYLCVCMCVCVLRMCVCVHVCIYTGMCACTCIYLREDAEQVHVVARETVCLY